MKTLTDIFAVGLGACIFVLIAALHILPLAAAIALGIWAARSMGWL